MKRVVWTLFQRACVDAATCLHATSAQEAFEIRQHRFGQPIAVIPNGVDIPLAAPSLQEREPVVLFMGRLHPKKGLDDLLDAWESIAAERPTWRLVIAGPVNSKYARGLVERVAKERIPRTSFVGEVRGDAKGTLLRTASLFVLPTYSENFGIAVAEALAAGTPVVVSRGAPWSEVEASGCGWWHPIGPAGAKDALVAATACPAEELHSMGLRGRSLVVERYGWQGVAHRMAQMYDWLLNGGAKPDSVV
jgi:glycosyltransferase involved in cell wall biosynthesis